MCGTRTWTEWRRSITIWYGRYSRRDRALIENYRTLTEQHLVSGYCVRHLHLLIIDLLILLIIDLLNKRESRGWWMCVGGNGATEMKEETINTRKEDERSRIKDQESR